LLPETRRVGEITIRRRWLDREGLRLVLQSPTVALLIGIFFLATFAFGNFEATLSLLTRDFLDLKDKDNYLIFAYIGLVLMLVQGLIYRRLASRVSEVTFMKVGLVLMVIGLLIGLELLYYAGQQDWLPRLPSFMADLAVIVAGFAFLTPSVQSLISRLSDPARQGEILGVNQSASALARILGPAIALPLFKVDGSHVLPYALGALLLMLVFGLTLRIRIEGAGAPSA
jgi:fucose permease